MTKKKHHYFMPMQVLSQLTKKGANHCVACEKEIQVNDEVYTKRSGNNLRLRCISCAKRYHII